MGEDERWNKGSVFCKTFVTTHNVPTMTKPSDLSRYKKNTNFAHHYHRNLFLHLVLYVTLPAHSITHLLCITIFTSRSKDQYNRCAIDQILMTKISPHYINFLPSTVLVINY